MFFPFQDHCFTKKNATHKSSDWTVLLTADWTSRIDTISKDCGLFQFPSFFLRLLHLKKRMVSKKIGESSFFKLRFAEMVQKEKLQNHIFLPPKIRVPPYLCRSLDPLSPRLKTPASQLEQLRELPNNHGAPGNQRRSPRESSPTLTAVFKARSPLKGASTQSIPTMCLWG